MNVFGVTYNVTDKYAASIKRTKGVSISENNGREYEKLPVPASDIRGQDGFIK